MPDLRQLSAWLHDMELDSDGEITFDEDGFASFLVSTLNITLALPPEGECLAAAAPLLPLEGSEAEKLSLCCQALAGNQPGRLPPGMSIGFNEADNMLTLTWQTPAEPRRPEA